jgi:hypothetical protein
VSQPTGIHRLENYVAVFKVIAFTREFQRIWHASKRLKSDYYFRLTTANVLCNAKLDPFKET